MKRQKKREGLNKNSGNGEKYKFSYCFTLLEKQFLVVVLGEFKRNEEKEKKKEREKRNCNQEIFCINRTGVAIKVLQSFDLQF